MKPKKTKLSLNKTTVANLSRLNLSNLLGGTAESTQPCTDPSRTTGCAVQDCLSRYWCIVTDTCPPPGD